MVSILGNLILSAHGVSVNLRFPESQLAAARDLRVSFSDEACTGLTTQIEVLADFVRYCSSMNAGVAVSAFGNLHRLFCSKDDIHVVVQNLGLSQSQTRTVLKGYFSAWQLLEQCQQLPAIPCPALFSDPIASPVAMFGGQGGMANYMDEAAWLFDIYNPLLDGLVDRLSNFLRDLSTDPVIGGVYKQPIDFAKWLRLPESMPGPRYMACSTVAVPLVALIQIMHLAVLYKTLRINPGELVRLFKGAIGHSQGLIIAALFATATDEASFYASAEKGLGILTVSSAGSYIDYPPSILGDNVLDDTLASGDQPSPMVSIRGLAKPYVEQLIHRFNQCNSSPVDHVHIALVNNHTHVVVGGVLGVVICFVKFIREVCKSPKEDQSHIPVSQRKPVAMVDYLASSVICHSPLMRSVAKWVYPYVVSKGFLLEAPRMQIPVSAGHDGHDLRNEENLTKALVDSMGEHTVDWPAVVKGVNATHIVDFSPGGFSIFALLTRSILEGSGTTVICAGSLTRSKGSTIGSKADLYQFNMGSIVKAPNFALSFGPRLVRTAHDVQVHIDSPMFRVLGRPPVMVSAMSPTAESTKFVAAINRAGYHAELTVSCRETALQLRKKVSDLLERVEPGQLVTICLNHTIQHHWTELFPAILRMRREGIPIGGLSISGGIPPLKVATDLVTRLHDAGIAHAALRPSTVADIRTVVAIAKSRSEYPILMLWTGGRCGGYHSWEDFHQPILDMYGQIRSQKNIVFIAASGIGNWESALPYISGEWSRVFGRFPMPFDGIALGSRLMVAKEAGTARAVKELIVAAPGMADSEWDSSCSCTAGGVISIVSENGTPMHVLATRAAVFIKDLQTSIFSSPVDGQLDLIREKREYIIQHLNSDYLKPWFGCKADSPIAELEDMAYSEVVRRMVDLMFDQGQSRWVHESFRSLVAKFIRRIEDRFSGTARECVLVSIGELIDPLDLISDIERAYPDMVDQLLTSEDISFFLELCKQAEPMPVPFVPVIDGDLCAWMMRGTDWQSEHLDSVIGNDPQKVIVCQGPVSAQYSTIINEPVQVILDGIYRSLVSALVDGQCAGNESIIPVTDYIGAEETECPVLPSVNQSTSSLGRTYSLPADKGLLPGHDQWLEVLAGSKKSWLRCLLSSPHILQRQNLVTNGVRQLLCPSVGQTVVVAEKDDVPDRMTVFSIDGQPDIIAKIDEHCIIDIAINGRALGKSYCLDLRYRYEPSNMAAPIIEIMEDRDERIAKLFLSAGSVGGRTQNIRAIDPADLSVGFEGDAYMVTSEAVQSLCESLGSTSRRSRLFSRHQEQVPIDLLYTIFQPYVAAIVLSHPWNIGLLDYLHLRNSLEYIEGERHIHVGDVINTVVRPVAIMNSSMGSIAKFRATFSRHSVPFAIMDCEYVCRNQVVKPHLAFNNVDEPRYHIIMESLDDIVALETKAWFVYRETSTGKPITLGSRLYFDLKSQYRYTSTEVYSSVVTCGPVYLTLSSFEHVHIADIDYAAGSCEGNPVIAYLVQHSAGSKAQHRFENGSIPIIPKGLNGTMDVTAPSDNWKYSQASGDYTAIHNNAYIAKYVGLPSIITHGMWTAGSTRALVEHHVTMGNTERMRSYAVDFVDAVMPGDCLTTTMRHVGMANGLMLVEGETCKQTGAIALRFSAKIEQPKTAYVFTGQGCQFIGMGTELYSSSAAAKSVWDRADKHMFDKYGVSLLAIVRSNPKAYRVKFDGKLGAKVRANYLSLVRQNGGYAACLFPGINEASASYTHRCANGLLNAALFTQPIQTVMSIAQVADMRDKGLIQKGAAFAGHSLGEFGSLAAIAEIVSIEDAVDIALYRGLLLHSSVTRDSNGLSEYAMVSVNPKCIGDMFDESVLLRIVDAICKQSHQLLEVINYNVRMSQYVVTGHVSSLKIMGFVLDKISHIGEIPDSRYIHALIACADGRIEESQTLKSGTATTVVPGVDVPSHSTQLLASVSSFRQSLTSRISKSSVSYDRLHKKYVPNLTGLPFELSRGYLETVYNMCKSPEVARMLESWKNYSSEKVQMQDSYARTLLIELLAYQIASPVQWVDTQATLFRLCGVKRLIEIGPGPTLSRMADQTLAADAVRSHNVTVLHVLTNPDAVYYKVRDTVKGGLIKDIAATPNPLGQTAASSIKTGLLKVSESVGLAQQNLTAESPVQMVDVVRAVVAQKTGKLLLEIPKTKSIKELVAGKSTVQNEIAAGLQKELGKPIPDNGEDIPLHVLAKKLGAYSGNLGRYTMAIFSRLVSTKLPGSISQSAVRHHLKSAYGLGTLRQNGVILLAITTEPQKRLPDDEAAYKWLDSVVQVYAQVEGITFNTTTPNSAAGANGSPVSNVAVIEKVESSQRELALQQIRLLTKYAGIDLQQGVRSLEHSQTRVNELETQLGQIRDELGDSLVDGSSGKFNKLKARRYSSYWNWARQDALEWVYSTIVGGESTGDTLANSQRLHMLKNRTTPGLLNMLKAVIMTLQKCDDGESQRAFNLVEQAYRQCEVSLKSPPVYRALFRSLRPRTTVTHKGEIVYAETPREDEPCVSKYIENMHNPANAQSPRLYIYEHSDDWTRKFSKDHTGVFFNSLMNISECGISFEGRTALITGCGQGSIGSGVLEALLSGGAKVIATTSNYCRRTTRYFEDIYRRFGARGSELVLVPFNQGSSLDVKALVDYIYNEDELGWDLDYVIPFAGSAERGRDLANIDSHSELAMRVSLTNLLRLLGEILRAKAKRNLRLSPTLVVLPHSSNYGVVGNDGLYSIAKIGLQTLYRRWYAEDWGKYLLLTGADIGWVRNTNMTSDGAIIYEDIERVCRTFSREEMSLNLIALLSTPMAKLAVEAPVFGNFNGGTASTMDAQAQMMVARNRINAESSLKKAILSKLVLDGNIEGAGNSGSFFSRDQTAPLANHRYEYPPVKPYEQLGHLRYLQGMVNLDKVVVVSGFGEVGPFGNSALRWEMEAYGEFSLEGCIELAWIMGLIKHFSAHHPLLGKHYIGWVDAKTMEPVRDIDVKAQYEQYILDHCGIRVVEPELHDGYDPNKKSMMRELQIAHDLEPFETTAEEAANFKLGNGDKVDVWENSDGSWSVMLRKGTVLLIPKALRFDRYVAAQLPTGWDPTRFGIPEAMLEHIDPVTSYALVATMESLVRSGIADPYEMYQYLHVSEIGYSIGSSLGGGKSIQNIFRGRWMDKDAHVETGVEATTNCISAWINMILLSAAGSLKPPVGACATVAMSLDIGIETIQSGKAKIMIVGASDSFAEDSAYEFGQLGATASAESDARCGREPTEMSRPCTETRGGFIEGYGSGIAVLMSASVALEMGAPVYGILALSSMATDKAGCNLTAPGQGLMTVAREQHSELPPVLDFGYRRRMLSRQLSSINEWRMEEIERVRCANSSKENKSYADTDIQIRLIELDALHQQREALNACGNDFWKGNPHVSPLRGALATWGLDIDSISVATFHGTSTLLNDRNESDVVNKQMRYLGRTPGLPIHVVCQKWLTGHSKGVAASWMLNGLLKSMTTGIIPGNANADNIDSEFEKFEYLVYPNRSMRVPQVKAGLLTSFGFGQVGGEIVVIHPDYLFATQTKEELDIYKGKVERRQKKSYRYLHDTLVENHTFIQPKETPPFTPEQELGVYLDPLARTRYDRATGKYCF